ncbi:MAG: calcium/proton exchanger [Chthonomonadales bacterium]|nr:calcium/proton exchanger [Chthonomonadales bacterium]
MRWMGAMLVLIPLSIALRLMSADPAWVFTSAALAIVPLAAFIGAATEELAKHLGPSIGGLLNATFGNAAELIITLAAIRAGELDVVRAAVVGSIIGNILLVLGASILVGGLRYKTLQFRPDVASTHTVTLVLAVIGICVPSLFVHSVPGAAGSASDPAVEQLSLWVSGVLIAIYIGNLVFTLFTHAEMFAKPDEGNDERPAWSQAVAYAVLAAATAVTVVESEMLVRAIEPTVRASGLNRLFVGVVIVPIVGNAAEHASAVTMAARNRMEVSLSIAVSSSTQIALFVAPLLVFVSIPLGHPMPFVFNDFELIAVGFAAVIAAFIARDGRCKWIEGAQLLAVYAILALAFFFIPR